MRPASVRLWVDAPMQSWTAAIERCAAIGLIECALRRSREDADDIRRPRQTPTISMRSSGTEDAGTLIAETVPPARSFATGHRIANRRSLPPKPIGGPLTRDQPRIRDPAISAYLSGETLKGVSKLRKSKPEAAAALDAPDSPQMTIASFNINNINSRLPNLVGWLRECGPDVVCLQETKTTDAEFPGEAIRKAGYHAVWRGEERWNGVAKLRLYRRLATMDVSARSPRSATRRRRGSPP